MHGALKCKLFLKFEIKMHLNFYLIIIFTIVYNDTCYQSDILAFGVDMSAFTLFKQFMSCSAWVSFFTVVAGFNLFWITCLCICHIYQTVFIGLTTNERLNLERYKHFYDKNGKYRNPFQ